MFQEDIDAVSAWSKKRDLKFNVAKCCVLHFGRSNIKAQNTCNINGTQLRSDSNKKDLGVLFSSNLKFNEHIGLHVDSIAKKANQKLGIIAKVFKTRNTKSMLTFFQSSVDYTCTPEVFICSVGVFARPPGVVSKN